MAGPQAETVLALQRRRGAFAQQSVWGRCAPSEPPSEPFDVLPPPLGPLPLSSPSPWAAPSPRYPFADCLEAGQDTAGLCRYIVFRYYPRGDLHRFVFDRFADTAGVQVTPHLALSSPLSIPI